MIAHKTVIINHNRLKQSKCKGDTFLNGQNGRQITQKRIEMG